MNQALKTSIDTLTTAVRSETPTIFWQEAMEHVAVLLEHVRGSSNATDSIKLTRAATSEGRFSDAADHLDQVLHSLQALAGAHVVPLSDLLVDFEAALMIKPFLWLEIGFNRVSGWMITVYDKQGGFERVVVQEHDLKIDDTCRSASLQLQALIKEEHHV
ncbi:hypothetical protein PSCICO_07810 [Pseudomonas cichorii]|uniref:hypothetical protein n=1 Tax=Pseudomonas cichorii TaxID=36746 RepID=UPI001910948E|nr:hypothetical protein [Pseudomonas cichorii]GFM85382.1 hypothetical protein PSCICO_07810 [Pseudomonas cichorii]